MMLTESNTRRGVAATMWLLAIMVTAAPGAAPGATPWAAVPPDAGDAVAAYLTLTEWVRSFDPPAPRDSAAAVPLGGATGVCVILRQRGRILGTGVDTGSGPRMLRRAAGRAMSEVLGNPLVRGLPAEARTSLGERLTVELEIAGTLLPLPGRSFAQLAEQVDPGRDGIALRSGDRLRVLFPAQIRATDSADAITRLISSLAVDLGLPLRDLDGLGPNVRVYRFETIHLVQRAPGRRPLETFRGQQIVPRDAVDAKQVAGLAAGLVNHLLASLWGHAEPLGMMGNYRYTTDTYTPLIAPPLEQALCAFALARAASTRALAPEADRLLTAAESILLDLASVDVSEKDPRSDPATCAAIVYAVSENRRLSGPGPLEVLFDTAAAGVRGAWDKELGFVRRDAEMKPVARLSPHASAIVAGALVRLQAMAGRGDGAVARSALDHLWSSVPPREHTALLPWVAWAEIDLARAIGHRVDPENRLRSLRAMLDATRISPPAAPDLIGGFALAGRSGSRATAQTARPAAGLATMLRIPELTPVADRPDAIERHLGTMRFLVQLAVSDDLLWAVPAPQRAKGGIRAATWSSEQPVAAQALALLAAAETLLSLETGAPDNP